MIQRMIKQNPSTKILCTAPSNDPTDHLAIKLSEAGVANVLRIHSGRIDTHQLSNDLKSITLRGQLEAEFGEDYDTRKENGLRKRVRWRSGEIVQQSNLICVTCNVSKFLWLEWRAIHQEAKYTHQIR